MSLKNSPALLALGAVFYFSSSLWAEDINIYFKASPRLELLYPYSDPATLTLLVTGTDGKPVAQGRVAIRLDAPEPGWFFFTDFPLVEGSRLLDMSLLLRQGKAEWKYLFPIRGHYRLTVEYAAPDGRKASKTFAFEISEHKQKWFFLGIFSLALFAVGAVAGRVFTASRSRRKITASLLLSLGSLLPTVSSAVAQEVERGRYFGWLEIEPATVGKPSAVRWRLAGGEKADGRSVLLTLTISHLEKGKQVFAVERISVPGEFAVNFQFADGAEYRISAIAYVTARTNASHRAKYIGHRRGTAGAGDDSRNRVFSRGDCVRFRSRAMEPPAGSIVTKEARLAPTKEHLTAKNAKVAKFFNKKESCRCS